jgi:hypothetical protein
MKKIIKYKVNAIAPRLSDEEVDPLEQDDNEGISTEMIEGFSLWSPEDMMDIRKLINERMDNKQQYIFHAFLEGMTYIDVGLTEKYWRYHFTKGIEFIKKELGI